MRVYKLLCQDSDGFDSIFESLSKSESCHFYKESVGVTDVHVWANRCDSCDADEEASALEILITVIVTTLW